MRKKNKLLIISGPTATEKSRLALRLAYAFNGELISADARDVYKGLDILTGKDIPGGFRLVMSDIGVNSQKIQYFGNGTRLWLIDCVQRNELFTASHYKTYVDRILPNLYSRGKLPIIVGGTGFYIKAVIDGFGTLSMPPNVSLRGELSTKGLEELQRILKDANPARFASMNWSDKNNQRRLIRAIEIAHILRSAKEPSWSGIVDIYWIGLTAPAHILEKNIWNRIQVRLDRGVIREVAEEVKNGNGKISIGSPLGFDSLVFYLQGKLSLEDSVNLWFTKERQYAKRQLTWFKKEKRITWFDISGDEWEEKVTAAVSAWYTYTNSYADQN